MILPDRLAGSLARLSTALARLQAAAEQRAQADAAHGDRDQEFALLQDDRNRLAAELDASLARQQALVAAQDEVFQRLDRASRTVEDVMQGLSHQAPPARDRRVGSAR